MPNSCSISGRLCIAIQLKFYWKCVSQVLPKYRFITDKLYFIPGKKFSWLFRNLDRKEQKRIKSLRANVIYSKLDKEWVHCCFERRTETTDIILIEYLPRYNVRKLLYRSRKWPFLRVLPLSITSFDGPIIRYLNSDFV